MLFTAICFCSLTFPLFFFSNFSFVTVYIVLYLSFNALFSVIFSCWVVFTSEFFPNHKTLQNKLGGGFQVFHTSRRLLRHSWRQEHRNINVLEGSVSSSSWLVYISFTSLVLTSFCFFQRPRPQKISQEQEVKWNPLQHRSISHG